VSLLAGVGLVAGGILLSLLLIVAFVTVSMNARASREDVVVSISCVEDDSEEFLRSFGGAVGHHAFTGNEVALFQNGAEIFPPMLEAIAKARVSVHFVTFIYWNGKVPETFAGALSAAARRGVHVRVVLDSDGAAKAPKPLVKGMEEAGVEVEWYRRAHWYDWESYNHRSHRRLLIVDGEVGFTGGVGIADEWSGDGDSPTHWRDTHARIRGPAVAGLQAAFVDSWNNCSRELPLDAAHFPEQHKCGDSDVIIVQSSPAQGTSAAQRAYAAMIAGAKKTLDISNAYFLPSSPFVDMLLAAHKRGVRVRVLMPGPYHDEPAVRRASRRTWPPLLKAGIELYEHQKTMMHAKVIVVDELVTCVGSINFDPRSFSLNAECAVVTHDVAIAKQALEAFEADLPNAKRVTATDLKQLSMKDRALDALCYSVRAQL
jgi:cardiolipin synthase